MPISTEALGRLTDALRDACGRRLPDDARTSVRVGDLRALIEARAAPPPVQHVAHDPDCDVNWLDSAGYATRFDSTVSPPAPDFVRDGLPPRCGRL